MDSMHSETVEGATPHTDSMTLLRHSQSPRVPLATGRPSPTSVKIVVAGGFGVGKTTFIGSISEIEPLTTEAAMTTESEGLDVTNASTDKTTTTVAMDFGRITIEADELILYLFGTPGQERFQFMWRELIKGAIGAVVLVDTSRLADSFPVIDFMEAHGLPFVVAVNRFEGHQAHGVDAIRSALALGPTVPFLEIDARDRASTRDTLIAVVQHALVAATS